MVRNTLQVALTIIRGWCYFVSTFLKYFTASLPLEFLCIQKKEWDYHRKLFKARTFLWFFEYTFEEPFPLQKTVVSHEYFIECPAKPWWWCPHTPKGSKCFVNPPQCELLPESAIKISSEGKAPFCYCRAEVQTCLEEASSSHCPYKNLSWLRGLRLGDVIPNFIVLTWLFPTLSYLLSEWCLYSWRVGGKGDFSAQLCQSCLTEFLPWKSVEQSCAFLFYKNLSKDNGRNNSIDY